MRRALAALFVIALGAGGAAAQPEAEEPGHTVTLVTDDVSVPVALAFLGTDDFLVIEKNSGRVQRFAAGTKSEVLDLAVFGCGERGLLGIAVHPDLGADVGRDWVYLYYTAPEGEDDETDCDAGGARNRVDRFTWDGSELTARTPILELPSDASSHNGGTLAFGPDGMLYGVIGDNRREGPLQNVDTGDPPDDTGMIFRVADDGAIPADNPFDADEDGLDPEDKLFAYGIRNSFGLAFDPETGELWDTENGPAFFDEINHVFPGFNSGWERVMGPAGPNPPDDLVELPGSLYADPAYSVEDPVALTALAFATEASALGSEFAGDLFVGDFLEGQIYRFALTGARDALDVKDPVANSRNELERHLFASGFPGGVGDLAEGPDGALWVVALDGGVYRIEAMGAHDLALAALKAPRRARISAEKSATGKLRLTLENRGTAPETIESLAALEALVTLGADALTGECAAPVPVLVPPKKGPPFVLAPRKKLKLTYTVELACAAADPEAVELAWQAAVDLAALGESDAVPGNDECPRAASAGDKGCGKPPGDPIRTDVVAK